MISELWELFPRLLENRINDLLDEAGPHPTRAFQIYKACQRDDLWHKSYEEFSSHLYHFFSLSQKKRHKSDMDKYLDRPMDSLTFANFHLDFRSALVSDQSIRELANWTHNMIRLGYKTQSAIISIDVMNKTLQHITNPPLFEKARDINFDDFCSAWGKMVFKIFGKQYEHEFKKITDDLQWMYGEIKKSEEEALRKPLLRAPEVYLTQTEIEWTTAVREAVTKRRPIPDFPLSKGPQKLPLVDLERTISLFQIVQKTKSPEFIKHLDDIRVTILDRCDRLLVRKAS